MTIEDTWGGDIVTTAVSHLAASTPPDSLFTVSFMNDWTNEHIAGHEPHSKDGFGAAPTTPGLGVEVDMAALGAPLFSAARDRCGWWCCWRSRLALAGPASRQRASRRSSA